jgi:hypothetical protein
MLNDFGKRGVDIQVFSEEFKVTKQKHYRKLHHLLEWSILKVKARTNLENVVEKKGGKEQ